MLEIEIEIEPISKARPRFTKAGHAYTTKETRVYETRLKQALLPYRLERVDRPVPVHLDVVFVRSIPKSWSKKKKQQAIGKEVFPTTRPDLDNYEKAVLDAANEILFEDDAQVVSKYSIKVYGEVPKVMIRINTFDKEQINLYKERK